MAFVSFNNKSKKATELMSLIPCVLLSFRVLPHRSGLYRRLLWYAPMCAGGRESLVGEGQEGIWSVE